MPTVEELVNAVTALVTEYWAPIGAAVLITLVLGVIAWLFTAKWD